MPKGSAVKEDSPLIQAIRKSDPKKLKRLLEKGVSPNTKSADGRSALELAFESNRSEIAGLLISAGADLAALNPKRANPVWAIGTGSMKALQWAVESGGDINVRTGMGTPINYAARLGHLDMVNYLIEQGADVNAGNLIGTPLSNAVQHQHTDCAIALLKAGANPRPERPVLDNLLVLAAHQKNPPLVKALLDAEYPANERGQIREVNPKTFAVKDLYDNATPLLVAARLGDLETVELLLAAGADPTARDEKGKRPLDLAKDQQVIARLQAALKQTPQKVNNDEDLLLACEKGDAAKVRALLTAGANVNARDERKKAKHATPLLLAIRAGHTKLVPILLDAGADPKLTDSPAAAARPSWLQMNVESLIEMNIQVGRSPLHEASVRGDLDSVKLLLDRGADPDPPDLLLGTPLMDAAEKGHADIVDRLIAAGADANARNSSKEHVLLFAVKSQDLRIVQSVLRAGAKPTGKAVNDILFSAGMLGSVPIMKAMLETFPKWKRLAEPMLAAFFIGAHEGRNEMVQYFLSLGFDVNARDKSGDTALYRACQIKARTTTWRNGKKTVDEGAPPEATLAVVKTLLDAGADPNLLSSSGIPAIGMAIYSGTEPLLDLLLDHGAHPLIGKLGNDTVLDRARSIPLKPRLIKRLEEAAKQPFKAAEQPRPQQPGKSKAAARVHAAEAAPPDLSAAANSSDFQKAVNEMEKLCGTKAQSSEHSPGYFHFHVDSRSKFDFDATRVAMLKRGYSVFWIDTLERQQVAILPTADQFLALRIMGTSAPNYDLTNEDIVAFLQKLHQEQPFEITGMRHDVIDGKYLTPIKDPKKLAQRLYEFCPDIVDQGVGSMAALVSALKKGDRLYFWWD